jgi:hypothetical protein
VSGDLDWRDLAATGAERAGPSTRAVVAALLAVEAQLGRIADVLEDALDDRRDDDRRQR